MEIEFAEAAKALRIALETVEHAGRVRHCGCGAYREAGEAVAEAVLLLSSRLDSLLDVLDKHPGTAQTLTRCRLDELCKYRRVSTCLGNPDV